jgi:hypothetical protein
LKKNLAVKKKIKKMSLVRKAQEYGMFPVVKKEALKCQIIVVEKLSLLQGTLENHLNAAVRNQNVKKLTLKYTLVMNLN